MDFQDRFRDRSSHLTKNGLTSIFNAPGKPISKANISQDLSFFIPQSHHVHNTSITELNAQKALQPSSSNMFHNNSGYSGLPRPEDSRNGNSGRLRSRLTRFNLFGMPQQSSRTIETEKDISSIRIHSLKAIERDMESFYGGYKSTRLKEKSLEVSKSRREGEMRPEEWMHTQEIEKGRIERSSHESLESRRLVDYTAKKTLRKTTKRGISMEIANNTKNVVTEYSQPATVRMKELFAKNEFVEKRQIYNMLPQLERSHILDTSRDSKVVLTSFREKLNQGSGYLVEHINQPNNSFETKRPMTRMAKTRSYAKITKSVEKEQIDGSKGSSTIRVYKEDKKTDKMKSEKVIKTPMRERKIELESEKTSKRVSFKDNFEMIKNKTFQRPKSGRLAVLRKINSETRT